jgi:hypothetical protein
MVACCVEGWKLLCNHQDATCEATILSILHICNLFLYVILKKHLDITFFEVCTNLEIKIQ